MERKIYDCKMSLAYVAQENYVQQMDVRIETIHKSRPVCLNN